MKLAFSGQGRYTDFEDSYKLYVNRSRNGDSVDRKTYNRIIRRYCSILAGRLVEYGIIDLPNDIGMIAASILRRRPQYRGKKFIGYGKRDWENGCYDGSLKTFGLVFLPKLGHKRNNFRSYGFVANRKLFKEMKQMYENGDCNWSPITFNDEMI